MGDIQWIGGLNEALAKAADLRRPVVVMPVGQGMDDCDQWCPAAWHTRANLSHPSVVQLIGSAFVPVRFSMHVSGPGIDDVGRKFVVEQPASGDFDIYPPDVFIVSPQKEVLARLPYDSTPKEILSTLTRVLEQNESLANPDRESWPGAQEPTDPAEIALRDIENRYSSETPERTWWVDRVGELFRVDGPSNVPAEPLAPSAVKAGLIPELEEWLGDHASTHDDLAAMARVLLGGARAHAGDLPGARAAWQSVIDLHPTHSLRHRAAYNLIEPRAFPSLPLTDIVGAPRPSAVEAGIVVPDPSVRERNMELVATDPRYVHLREGLPFVKVPAGSFTMGGTPVVQSRESPVRRVTLTKPYLIAAWPITRGLYHLFRPERHPGKESEGLAAFLPVVNLSRIEVLEFCEFLSALDGRRYRLPTEAEWEFAARGGLEGKRHPWGDEPADASRCNYVNKHPVPVGSYPANGYGLFDSVGNCFEWCADFYRKDAYALTPSDVVDPTGPTEAQALEQCGRSTPGFVARGGGWIGNSMCHINCRNSWRIGWPAGYRWPNLGARLVVDVD